MLAICRAWTSMDGIQVAALTPSSSAMAVNIERTGMSGLGLSGGVGVSHFSRTEKVTLNLA
jgi:hypothetical protein